MVDEVFNCSTRTDMPIKEVLSEREKLKFGMDLDNNIWNPRGGNKGLLFRCPVERGADLAKWIEEYVINSAKDEKEDVNVVTLDLARLHPDSDEIVELFMNVPQRKRDVVVFNFIGANPDLDWKKHGEGMKKLCAAYDGSSKARVVGIFPEGLVEDQGRYVDEFFGVDTHLGKVSLHKTVTGD